MSTDKCKHGVELSAICNECDDERAEQRQCSFAAPAGSAEFEPAAIGEAIRAAREVQNFLWGHPNGSWGLEEWLRMFRKRVAKLEEVKRDNPHAAVELQKRLLQTAALAVALMAIIRARGVPWEASESVPSNLPQYVKPIEQNS